MKFRKFLEVLEFGVCVKVLVCVCVVCVFVVLV